MPFTPTPQVLTTTMVNTLSTAYQMWVVGPSQFASLSPVTLQPVSQTPVNSNFVNAWVQQNQDQNVLNSLQVYPVGFVPLITNAPVRISSAFIPSSSPILSPTVISSTFQLSTLSLTVGQTIGQVIATNSPTAWSFLSGGTAFAISSTGSLTLSANGTALQNTSGVQSMVVQATNAVGSGTGTITVNLSALQSLTAGGRAKGPAVTGRLNAPTGTTPLQARSKTKSNSSHAFLQVPIALISGSGAMLLDHSGNALTYQQH